jgi:drug/metabolite transporter (DMT)-like permease
MGIIDAFKPKEIFMYVLGAFVVGCSASVICLLIFFPVPSVNHDAIMMAVGTLLGMAVSVVGYFYGSSKGSSDKTDIIKSQNNPE